MPGRATVRGYIEKKKDWLERAHDYQDKEKKIRYLKQKAKDRNPDEFNYHMIRSIVRLDGVHQDLPDLSDDETEVQKLLSDVRDLEYVRHKLSLEQKKIEKLKGVLHFSGVGESSKHVENKRIIFVDSEDDAIRKKDEIQKRSLEAAKKSSAVPEVDALMRERYAELALREGRAKELRIALSKLELKKNLATSKGRQLKPKLVKKGGPTKAAQYKWTFERKK